MRKIPNPPYQLIETHERFQRFVNDLSRLNLGFSVGDALAFVHRLWRGFEDHGFSMPYDEATMRRVLRLDGYSDVAVGNVCCALQDSLLMEVIDGRAGLRQSEIDRWAQMWGREYGKRGGRPKLTAREREASQKRRRAYRAEKLREYRRRDKLAREQKTLGVHVNTEK